jgi:hypothetical protein
MALWLDLLILIGIIVAVLILYQFINFLIKRAARSGKIPSDVVNGIKLLVRLIIVIVIVVLIVSFFELPPEITFAISAITGTIIGFASMEAIQNFISGVYIVLTRPFGIGDLVAINADEGVISEISLNYSKLVDFSGRKKLISNRNVLKSNLINYTKEAGKSPSADESVLKILEHIFIGKEITRYTFTLELPRDDPKFLKEVLEETVAAWEPKFGNKPQFLLWKLDYFVHYCFILTADEPGTILKNKPSFIKDIYRRIYAK